jgi:hypothetical protein
MVYATHYYLGTLLYPVIRDAWGVPLSKKRFLRGCVKPDVCSLFIRHPHFWRLSKKFLKKRIRKLCGAELRAEKKNRKFSEHLGIVLHYTADFFTSVHNITPNDLKKHMAFERKLDEAFSKNVNEEAIADALVRFRAKRGIAGTFAKGECEEELVWMHKTNNPEPKDVEYDIKEIIAACILVTCGIMDTVSVVEPVEATVPAAVGGR